MDFLINVTSPWKQMKEMVTDRKSNIMTTNLFKQSKVQEQKKIYVKGKSCVA